MADKINWSLIKDYQSFNTYVKLVDRIGRGTNGIVFKAIVTQGEYEYTIAVKRIELIDSITEDQIKNFNKENEFLNGINNSNIMKVYFQFAYQENLEKQYFIGMEYGVADLNSVISTKGQQTEQEITVLAKELWNGLHYLEENQTAHRDLKPENVILSQDGKYKLCDFGEIKFSNQTFKTMFQSFAGTPPYLSPELYQAYLNNQPNTNYNAAKSDTFSYGVLLLQALIGCAQKGIQGINTNPQMAKDFLNSNCSESFNWFLQNCLEFDPNKRWTFKDMKEIFDLNPIDTYFQLHKKNEEIKKLKEDLNQITAYQNEIKDLNLQIKNLDSKNIKLTQELEKLQQIQFNINSGTLKAEKQQQLKANTREEIIKKCKDNQEAWNNKDQTYRKNEFGKNTKLKWNKWDYGYVCGGYRDPCGACSCAFWKDQTGTEKKTYWRFSDGDYHIDEKDTPTAIQIVKELEKVTGQEFEYCLRMLHSNLWNFEKSKNDLLS